MPNIQKYADFTIEDAQKSREELGRLSPGGDFFKFQTGRNVVRFLPARIGETPFVIVQQHFISAAGGSKKIVFVCPRIHAKRFCPGCAKADELLERGNVREADELKPGLNVFANIIDRKNPERGVVVARFGKQIYEQLMAIRENEDGGGNFTDPGPGGFDIIVEKSGAGMDTSYNVLTARKESALGNDEWLDAMPDLKRYARVPSEEEVAGLLGGGGRRGGGGGGGRTGAAAPAAGQQRKGRVVSDDVMDDE